MFSDENISPNSSEVPRPQKQLGLVACPDRTKFPQAKEAPQHPHVECGASAASAERGSCAAPSMPGSSMTFENEWSREASRSAIVTGLHKSAEASKAIGLLGSSFGQVMSIKFHEPTTATVSFLTVSLRLP